VECVVGDLFLPTKLNLRCAAHPDLGLNWAFN
jgi:hypothetical protein